MNKTAIAKSLFIFGLLMTAVPPSEWLSFHVSPPLALFAGIAFAWLFDPVFVKFSKKAQKFLLQASVVGLGFGMDVEKALASGKEGMLFTIVSVAVVMILGRCVGRFLKVEPKTSYLVSAGTAICGGSAIAAVSPIIEADEDTISVSLGTVFLLNALSLFVFPPLGRFFGMTELQFGEWVAIAIHDTSSVVGAGAAFGDEALQVAAMVKCTRALWILPLALVTMLVWRRKGVRLSVPWFIILFALAMTVNTYCGLPAAFGEAVTVVAKRGFALTLFLVGTALSPKALKACGVKPLVQGVVLWVAVAALSFFVIM